MVARGDLGLSCAPEDVPRYQKEILTKSRARGKPAIVATQMLLSMKTDPEPRRPEAADVFNAVLDGADALMLPGETAVGARPTSTVETLHRIAAAAERFELGMGGRALALRKAHDETQRLRGAAHAEAPSLRVTDQLTFEAVRLADDLRAAAIVGATRSGRTVFNLSRYTPRVPVVAIVPNARVARRLALVRGVRPMIAPGPEGTVDFEAGLAHMRDSGLVEPGALVVVVSTRKGDPPGATTVLEVRVVD
jgi:pyruvate kinase